MGVKPASVDSESEDLLDQLNQVRLTRDWSYRQLSDDIEKVTGYVVSAQTLQPLLSAPRAERAKPFDRTLHKIRRYLDALRPPKRRAS
jgi:hypothetical protein